MRGEPQLAHRVIVFDIIQLYAISLKLSDFPEECLHRFLWSFAPEVRKMSITCMSCTSVMDEYYYMYMLPLLSDYIIQLNDKLETLQNGFSWDQNLK